MRVADRVVLHRTQAKSLAGVVGRLLEAAVVEHQGFGLAVFEEQLAVVGALEPAADLAAHGVAVEIGAVEKRGCGVHFLLSVACGQGEKIVFRAASCEGVARCSLAALGVEVADIFVSYTSKDRDWAFWIGQELEKLGHVARIDAWELTGGDNIMA